MFIFFQGQKIGDVIEENDRIDFKCEDGYAKNMHINIICKVRGYALYIHTTLMNINRNLSLGYYS